MYTTRNLPNTEERSSLKPGQGTKQPQRSSTLSTNVQHAECFMFSKDHSSSANKFTYEQGNKILAVGLLELHSRIWTGNTRSDQSLQSSGSLAMGEVNLKYYLHQCQCIVHDVSQGSSTQKLDWFQKSVIIPIFLVLFILLIHLAGKCYLMLMIVSFKIK